MMLLNRLVSLLIVTAPSGMYAEDTKDAEDADRHTGKVSFESWISDRGEGQRQYVRLTCEHLRRPASSSGLVDGVTPPAEMKSAIHKLRGFLRPESSGIYRFHVKGQGKVRFPLSNDDAPLGAVVLAEGGRALEGGQIDLEDPAIFPDGAPVHLEAGQSRDEGILLFHASAATDATGSFHHDVKLVFPDKN